MRAHLGYVDYYLVLLVGALVVALTGCEPAATPTRPPLIPTTVAPAPVAKPAGLDIPAIGVHVEGITELTLDANDAMEIPKDPGTVGWYPLGPAPGEVGPAVLTSHVNWKGTPGVFNRLSELKEGDDVFVPRADGTTAAFKVYRVAQVPKDAFPTGEIYGDTTAPELRLITCGGKLDQSAHSYLDNVIAFARLAS